MILSHRMHGNSPCTISATRKFVNWLPGFLAVITALVVLMFGLENISRLHGYKQAHGQTYTPWVRVYGGNSTGPFTTGVGGQIPWRYEALGADRVDFYARPISTTGNCSMNVNEWFDWKPSTTAQSGTISTDATSACQAGGKWQVAAVATKGTLSMM